MLTYIIIAMSVLVLLKMLASSSTQESDNDSLRKMDNM